MKDFVVTLSKDCRLSIPKQLLELMNLKPNDFVILKVDNSLKSFTTYKAKFEVA